ncbi:hypothetical protein [Microbulbifer sp. YPW1]|uniref:hypothetical protein n=1 Tax=Microbulbifer sp. YPW1 TaxID=2745199 RepID=UPI00159B155B|nr:hypothetical protein [Microbulbifer sp. YPW1]QKX17174.1 hypothetical protein HUW35_09285 [Microbulbifer sp. YPW1]
MFVECSNCGNYEISPELYDELLRLSESDWRIERLRLEVANIAEPRMIWKSTSNIPKFTTIGFEKPTEIKKRFLRAKAEGRTVTGGTISHVGDADNEPNNNNQEQ